MTITLSPAYHTKAQEHCVHTKRHTAEMRYPEAKDESEARKQPKTNPSDKRTPHKSRSLSGRTKRHTAEMRYPGAWMKARQENNPKRTPPTNARLIKAEAKRPPQTSYRRNAVSRS